MKNKQIKSFYNRKTYELIIDSLVYFIPKKKSQFTSWIVPITLAIISVSKGITVMRYSYIINLIDSLLVFLIAFLAIILTLYTIFYNGLSPDFVSKLHRTRNTKTGKLYIDEYLEVYQFTAIIYVTVIFSLVLMRFIPRNYGIQIVEFLNADLIIIKVAIFITTIILIRIILQSIYVITNSLRLFNIAVKIRLIKDKKINRKYLKLKK